MYSFRLEEKSFVTEDLLSEFETAHVFSTPEWLNFIEKDSKVKSLIVSCFYNEGLIGIFCSFIWKIMNIVIIGSPFDGWSACYLGLITKKKDDINEQLYTSLIEFINQNVKYDFIQIVDYNMNFNKLAIENCKIEEVKTPLLNIQKTDEELFKIFKTDCRNFIRQFEKRGAIIRVSSPNEVFAKNYYNHLIDVFDKQGLKPTYKLNKVKELLKQHQKSDNILCLEVFSPEGKSIACSIFFAFNEICYFWGGASLREYQHYRPNEYMIWTAIKHWRERNISYLDMVGVRPYKMKFGPEIVKYYKISIYRSKMFLVFKNIAKKLFLTSLRFRRKL